MNEFIGRRGYGTTVKGRIIKIVRRQGWDADKKSLVLILTNDRNVISFSSSGDFRLGSQCEFSGSVKRHSYFGRQRQTHIVDWALTYDYSAKYKTGK
jgi:hypothetical protein